MSQHPSTVSHQSTAPTLPLGEAERTRVGQLGQARQHRWPGHLHAVGNRGARQYEARHDYQPNHPKGGIESPPLLCGSSAKANLAHTMAAPNKPWAAAFCKSGCASSPPVGEVNQGPLQLGGCGMLILRLGYTIHDRQVSKTEGALRLPRRHTLKSTEDPGAHAYNHLRITLITTQRLVIALPWDG